MEKGCAVDALTDFTGGMSEKWILRELELDDPENKKLFYNELKGAFENQAIIYCYVAVSFIIIYEILLL